MAFPYVLVSKFMSRNSFESCQGVANVLLKRKISNARREGQGGVLHLKHVLRAVTKSYLHHQTPDHWENMKIM